MTTMKNAETMTNGVIELIDDEITLTGSPPYDLPETIGPNLINKLFSYHQDDHRFIGLLAGDFTSKARERLMQTCRSLGGTFWNLYRINAKQWVSVTSENGKWCIDRFSMVYEAEVAAPKIERIAISNRNMRFVLTPRGWKTFQEFEWLFSETVLAHIEKFIVSQTERHEAQMESLCEISKVIRSEFTTRQVAVASDKGVEVQPVSGLACLGTHLWKLPKGLEFLNEVDTNED